MRKCEKRAIVNVFEADLTDPEEGLCWQARPDRVPQLISVFKEESIRTWIAWRWGP